MRPVDASDGECDKCRRDASGKMRQPERSLVERLSMMINDWLDLQLERRRGRLELLDLSDEQLEDIGLSRRQPDGEIRRRPRN